MSESRWCTISGFIFLFRSLFCWLSLAKYFHFTYPPLLKTTVLKGSESLSLPFHTSFWNFYCNKFLQMLQKANSKRVLIILLLQLHLRPNSLRLVHPNRPFRRTCQGFLRLLQSKSLLCHLSWQPSTEQGRCPDVDEEEDEEELSNGLPWAPQSLSHRLCPPWLRCSCLCTLTLGLKKAFGGSVPGRTTKAGGHQGPAVVEMRDNQDRSLLHVQNILFFLWQPHNSQCNYPSGWGAREVLKKSNLMECKRKKEGKM